MSTKEKQTLIDQKNRKLVANKIYENFFIEAGAGTGKTTSLVERIGSFIKAGVPFEEILIITFTRKATGEIRHRIRKNLIENNPQIGHENIDKIGIHTIHGFFQLILSSYPTIINLPYNFTILESNEEEKYFIKRWQTFIENLNDKDPVTKLALDTHTDKGLKIDYASGNVFDMARTFQENYHLLKDWDLKAKKSELNKKTEKLNAKCIEFIPENEFIFEIWIYLLADFTLTGIKERIHNGQIIYGDLSLLTLQLLNDSEESKRIQEELGQKYSHILIDEFQDTDAIQLDIAMLISENSAKQKPTKTSITVVGDIKQSIYSFRGADADNYEKAKNNKTMRTLKLVQNFRTIEPIISWINSTLNLDIPASSSPQGELKAVRQIPKSKDIGPPVVLLENSNKSAPINEKIKEEAENIALSILLMIEEKWKVEDNKKWRPVELRDICMLVPKRPKIDIFIKELEYHNIPFLLELGEFVYELQEVRDLIHTLYALENPDNALAVVRALRTPLFGVGDDELYDYKKTIDKNGWKNKNGWNYLNSASKHSTDKIPEKIKSAFDYLEQTYKISQKMELGQLVQYIIHSRLQLEIVKSGTLKFAKGDFEFQRIEKQLEIFVNLISEYSATSLTEVLTIIQAEITNNKKFNPPLQDDSNNALRIMTMHSSKGLEFPVVILGNLLSGKRKGVSIHETDKKNIVIYFNQTIYQPSI